MDHVDIEVSRDQGHIYIFTGDGDLIEMHVPGRRDSVVEAMRARPPSLVILSGAVEEEHIAEALTELGHEVTLAAAIG